MDGRRQYDGVFFHIGDSDTESHFGVRSLTRPMIHRATRMPVWTLANGRHVTPSTVGSLKGKTVFVSHAICCENIRGEKHQAYRMYTLHGSEASRATVIRKSMCAAKIEMLEEVLHYAALPEYLGNPCKAVDIADPISRAISAIRRFPASVPHTTHIIG